MMNKMKHIVYLNNYMLEDIIEIRNNKSIFSQPANNKIIAIRKSLEANDCNVTILSSGLVNNKSFKFYNLKKSYLDNKLIYCSIIDIPLINTISSIISMYRTIKHINNIKKIDNIIFYNYKPEVAWAAWLAKKILKIPITLEYEDGYDAIESIGEFKKMLFEYTEKVVKKSIDSAILVTSKLKDKINVKNIIVRGVINEEFYMQCRNLKNRSENKNITLLYSGGIDRERGIEVLLESLNHIDDNFDLIITGKGSLEYKVMENDDKRIKYLGFIDYDKVKANLINADILINCQLENHDFGKASFPSKIFEYIATGNIIISSGVSDIKEFGEECFYFYDNDNPVELANMIKKAIYDVKNKNTKHIEALKKICNENTYKNIGKEILKVLN